MELKDRKKMNNLPKFEVGKPEFSTAAASLTWLKSHGAGPISITSTPQWNNSLQLPQYKILKPTPSYG